MVRWPWQGALVAAVKRKDPYMMELFLAHGDPSAAVIPAIDADFSQGLARLLDAGASPDAGPACDAPVLHAAWKEWAIDALVAHGARLDARDCRGRTALHVAVEKRSPPTLVQKLLRAGAPVDATNDDGDTALMLAVRRGDIEMAISLIRGGASVGTRNVNGRTAMMDAELARLRCFFPHARPETERLVGVLATAGAHAEGSGANELIHAIELHDEARVHRLLSEGVSPRTRDPEGRPVLVRGSGDPVIVGHLLAAGADVNEAGPSGVTALMAATAAGAPLSVSMLLHAGADVERRATGGGNALSFLTERLLVLPVQCAAGSSPPKHVPRDHEPPPGAMEVLDLLLLHGADPAARDGLGRSPLEQSLQEGVTEMVERLLAAGADPNGSRDGERCPIFGAAAGGTARLVRALLVAGASPVSVDSLGQTPLAMATAAENTEVAELLREAMK